MSTERASLVLLPGLLCDALLWQFQVAGLGDMADCWIAAPSGSESMAEVAAEVLRAAPFSRFALAGLSMGGYIALQIMRQAPDRVSSLALLDTSARADTPDKTRRRHELIDLAERGRFPEVTEALLPDLIHRGRLTDQGLTGTIRTMARNVGKAAFVRQERAIMSRPQSLGLLASIECPTLVLCGREDALTPVAVHEELASGIRGARLHLVEDCGHMSTLEKPDAVNRELRHWLCGSAVPTAPAS